MVRASAFAAIIAAAAGASVVLNAPPIGSSVPVTGAVTGAPAGSTAIIMISDDQAVWWDKTHSKGAVVNGAFENDDWVWNAEGDPIARYMGVWVVPPSFDLAGFSCEGAPVPASLTAAAVATSIVDRTAPTTTQQLVSPSPSRAAAPGGGGGGSGATASPPAKVVASGAGTMHHAAAAIVGAAAIAVAAAVM